MKTYRAWIGGGIVVVLAVALFAVWRTKSYVAQPTEQGMKVVATFFPLADFARSVGADTISVVQVTPDGVEPHDYEPSPQDSATLLSADVVLINGGGVDSWAEKLIPEAEAAGAVVVRMSDVVSFVERGEDDEHANEEDDHGHEGGTDPHVWLDIARAQEMVRAIASAFIAQDAEHHDLYTANANAFISDLASLDTKFSQTLATCTHNTVLVAHDAFHYWELRYPVIMESIAGMSPDAEPSVQDLVHLAEEAKELGITTVFFESPATTKVAETIAKEIGAVVDVLYPLESRTQEQIASGATYTSIMEQNLTALSQALACTTP